MSPGSRSSYADRRSRRSSREFTCCRRKQRGEIGTRLLEAGLAECAEECLKRLTVSVERDNRTGPRFYEQSGFGELREHSQDVRGFALDLVEYRRLIS